MANCPDPAIKRFPTNAPEELDSFFRDVWPSTYEGVVELAFFRDVLKRLLRALRVRVISGEITIQGLSQGAFVFVYVDHSDKAKFEFCEHPRFVPVSGVRVLLYEMAEGKATDGSGFVVRVENVSAPVSGSVPEPITLCWERRGMTRS